MLLHYAAERLRTGPLLAATSIVAGAAASITEWHGSLRFAGDLVLAFALIVHFRMWDDISDRQQDAVRHPNRVTVRASSPAPLRTVAVTIAIGCAAAVVLCSGFGVSFATLVATWLCFGTWYRWRGPRTAWSDHVLLAKYPAFIVVVAGSRVTASPALFALSLTVVYLAFCVYEAWHDAYAPLRRARIAIEAPLLGSTAVALGLFAGGVS
jgi:4-hydroxybenzoate polyprenyltransferase